MSDDPTTPMLPRKAPTTPTPFVLQLLLVGVFLPLGFLFMMLAQRDLYPVWRLSHGPIQVVEGRVSDVATAHGDTQARVTYEIPDAPEPLMRHQEQVFSVPPTFAERLRADPKVSLTVAVGEPNVARLNGLGESLVDGLAFLAAGLALLLASLAAGWMVWRTPS